MRCEACGADNPTANRFCGNCGTPLAAACPACGQANPPTNRFCGQCGTPLNGRTPSHAPAQQPLAAPPRDYTPQHLAENILAGRAALEGERKQVTVLFADVVGSTELIRDLDPEDAQRLLDGAVTRMMEAVHRFEGTVSRAMGDGIMALFGAPLAHEDHALRACYAALAMHEAMGRYAEEARRAHGLAPSIRVGLNSGEVVVRLISDDLHMDYTALGATVHLASRMEQLTKPDTTALTAETLAQVEGYVEVRSLGVVPVKGLASPIEAYELVGAGGARTRLQAAAARGLTRFVGRHAELETIYKALERSARGQGQVVAVVGEPGVGKSRVVWEITHSERVRGWTILVGGAVSYGKATPYLPITNLLRAYFRVEARGQSRTVRDRIAERLRALDRSSEGALPALLSLLDVPVEEPEWDALDPPQRRKRTLDALKHLLLRESHEQPLLLVVEDLHWADSETQALLDHLVEGLPAARVLLLVDYRPEYRHDWGGKTYYTQIRIDPLPAESAGELLDSLVGADPSVGPLKALLIERTEGTPFFLEESVRTLVDTRALAGERGAYRLAKPLPNVRVPATVQAVLAARIDRLPPEDKRLLQTAAVIGKDLPYALLRAVADVEEEGLRACLGRLRGAEFLYEANPFPEPLYSFKHALTHEVAYGSLLQERRRALHGRILQAIEVMHADYLDEQAETLAHHAIRAERWAQAVTYARQAAARAAARSAYREAAAWLDRVLAAAGRLPEGREAAERAVDIRLDLRQVLNPLGENRRALEHLREAEALAERLGDRHRLARVLSMLMNALYHVGDSERAVDVGERAVALAEALGDERLRVAASYHFASPCRECGDPLRPIEGLRRSIAYLDKEGSSERLGLAAYPAASCRGVLAICLADLGQFDEATAWGEEAVRIADQLDHPFTLALVLTWVGGAHTERGHLDAAAALVERAVGICESWDLPNLLPLAASRLGHAYALGGRADEGAALLRRAVEQAGRGGGIAEDACRAAWFGEACLLAGRIEEAARLARGSLDRATAGGERRSVAWAARLLGEVAARDESPKFDEAERHYQQALALAEELGMRPLQAHCHLGLGTLYRRSGRADEARTELSAAVEMLRAMEMTFWLPGAEDELMQTG